MIEMQEGRLSPEREVAFQKAEKEFHYPIEIYRLGDRFENLPPELAGITILDVTKIPGCHYGANNIFVPIIHRMERTRNSGRMAISPQTAILVEASTGNGWVAFSDAASALGYEHIPVMPDGLPEARYRHPQGRKVEIIRTPKEKYAEGMPEQVDALIRQNRQRLRKGEKIYASPDHAVRNADITVKAMSDLGRQLLAKLPHLREPLRVVISMGNGASLCAVGEYVKKHSSGAKVVATESFAYGGGYDWFAREKGFTQYRELFAIDPGHPALMAKFSTFGTNAPIGIELPLQTRAIEGGFIDDYILFTDTKVLQAYEELGTGDKSLKNALDLPNYSTLPSVLSETYGNSTIANIAVARLFTNRGERVVAIAYDSRKNY